MHESGLGDMPRSRALYRKKDLLFVFGGVILSDFGDVKSDACLSEF